MDRKNDKAGWREEAAGKVTGELQPDLGFCKAPRDPAGLPAGSAHVGTVGNMPEDRGWIAKMTRLGGARKLPAR